MAMPCRTCRHPALAEINTKLVRGGAAQALAVEYGLSPRSVQRHAAEHVPRVLSRAQDAVEMAEGDRLLAELHELHQLTRSIIAHDLERRRSTFDGELLPFRNGDRALKAIDVARRNIELLLRVSGELEERAEERQAAQASHA